MQDRPHCRRSFLASRRNGQLKLPPDEFANRNRSRDNFAGSMQMILLLAMLSVSAPPDSCLSDEVAPGQAVDDADSNDKAIDWRQFLYCGVNSTYAYLKLHDVGVEYDDVVQGVPVNRKGSNLKDIATFASHAGAPSLVVRSKPAEFRKCPMPAIAHLSSNSTRDFDSTNAGHYVVVLGASDAFVLVLDGTTGELRHMPAELFFRSWSGLLVVKDQPSSRLWIHVSALCAVAATIVAWKARRSSSAALKE
jgi:hypothetical protein